MQVSDVPFWPPQSGESAIPSSNLGGVSFESRKLTTSCGFFRTPLEWRIRANVYKIAYNVGDAAIRDTQLAVPFSLKAVFGG